MIRRIIYATLAIVLVVAGLSVYVVLRVGPDFRAAQELLRSADRANQEDIEAAQRRIGNALAGLESVPARILSVVPVVRQNLDAVRATIEPAGPALEAATDLRLAIDRLRDRSLISGGTVDLEALESLIDPLARAEKTMGRLEHALDQHRTGWLLPPIWNRIDELLGRTREFRTDIARTREVVSILSPLFGGDGRRDYVVLLMNNAELRGAGGIVAGVGRLTVIQGRLELGPFSYYQDVSRSEGLRRVAAPRDYGRRFARVGANSTLWINTTYSPDIPDVAVVASRLYEVSTGHEVDGMIMADARGFSALLPAAMKVDLPTGNKGIAAGDIPTYAYSGQYRDFSGPDDARREALVNLGRDAFDALMKRGSISMRTLGRAGDAVAGGHLRVVSLDPAETAALIDAGIAGDLSPTPSDSVLVTVQNVGGDKLDYWIDRKVEHLCDIRNRPARCATRVTLTNTSPRGLPTYVSPRPRALAKDFLEIYVPATAEISHVRVNGAPADHFDEEMAGRLSVGLEVEVARGDSLVATVGYYLPFGGDEYSLLATPQPLSRDAMISLTLRAPDGWIIEGPDGETTGRGTYEGPFDRPLQMHAHPDERSGLAALWDASN